MKVRRQLGFRLRVTPEELQQMKANFPPRKLGATLRNFALGFDQPRQSSAVNTRQELTRQLARIGNNLNQIAHGINVANLAGSRLDVLRVLAELAQIRAEMGRL